MSANIISPQPNHTGPALNSAKHNFLYYVNAFFAKVTPKPLTKGVKISTTIHLSLLLFAIIAPLVIHHRYRPFAPTVYTVRLINMPDPIAQSNAPSASPVITQEPKQVIQKPKIETPPKPKTETKKIEQKPVEKPIQQKPKMTIPEKKKPKEAPKEKTPTLEERLEKRLKETDGKKTDTKKDWREANKANASPDDSLGQENQVVSGTLGGTNGPGTLGVGTPTDFPFYWYLANIHSKISSCWDNPETLLDKKQSAIASFTITTTGEIINVGIKKSSGIPSFDQSALKAIEDARPYPELPKGFKDPRLTVNVEFSLENMI